MKKWLLPLLIIATVLSVFCILKFCVDTTPPTYAAERKDINIDFLTACTPLAENRYYCVSDFNEWRIRSTAESVPTREGDK